MHKRLELRINTIREERAAVLPAKPAARERSARAPLDQPITWINETHLINLLRTAAALLLALPAAIVALCFAHGHGLLGGGALHASLFAVIGLSTFVGVRLSSYLKPLSLSHALPRTAKHS